MHRWLRHTGCNAIGVNPYALAMVRGTRSRMASSRGTGDIAEQIKTEVTTPASDSGLSDCIDLPDPGNNPDYQAVLQYAMGREHAAMQQYRSLAESVEPGPIKDLFRFLADEETRHKLELE
jgi:hypothetical protein